MLTRSTAARTRFSVNVGEMQVQAAVMIPAAPVRAAGAAMKWAADRIGPVAWVIAGVLIGGGIYWYCKQSPGAATASGKSRAR